MDEAGVNLAMVRLYARAPKGQRTIGDRPANRGKNVSLVNALSLRGPIAPLTHHCFEVDQIFSVFCEDG
jgi:hypothetical protein